MNMSDLTLFIKYAIFDAPACPDGTGGIACPSCLADFVAERLVFVGHISLADVRW